MIGRFEYAPGDTLLIAGPSVAVLASIDPTGDLARALAAQAESPSATIDSMLEILVAPGLRAVDSFALLSTGLEDSRIVVRGQFRGCCSGNSDLLGRGLWSDHTFTSQQVRIEATRPGPVWLQITHGMVLASACRPAGVLQPYDEVSVMTHRASDIRRVARATVEADPVPEAADVVAQTIWAGSAPVESQVPDAQPSADQVTEAAPRRSASGSGDEPVSASPEGYDFDGLFDIDHTRSAIELRAAEAAEAAEPLNPAQPSDPPEDDPPVSVPVSGHTLPSPMTGELPRVPTVEPTPQPPPRPAFISSFPWATDSAGADQTPRSGQESTSEVVGAQESRLAAEPDSHPGRVLEEIPEPGPITSSAGQESAEPVGVPMVLAIRCPTGHLNAVHTEACRVCGLAVPRQQTPVSVPRPPLGVLRLGSGGTVLLDRGAILGRSPRLPRGLTGLKPNLVRLPDPDRDISSMHLEVSLDGWRVTVTDLGSTNGTQLELPGSPPISLRPKDPHTIEPGTRITLAEVCSFVFEVIE